MSVKLGKTGVCSSTMNVIDSQICFKEKLDLLQPTFGMLPTQTILQLKLQILNTSYWISIPLDSYISLTLSDPWRTSVHGYWYITICYGWLRDKNLMQGAGSASHGDMLMVSRDSVSDTAFRYEYQNRQPCKFCASNPFQTYDSCCQCKRFHLGTDIWTLT